MTRRFTAPDLAHRCICTRKALSDGSLAQCMRAKAPHSDYCSVHNAMFDRRVKEQHRSHESLMARLAEKAAEAGPGSIWAEMLAEQEGK